MAVTELYALRKDIGVRPLGRKEVTDVRFFRDHSSLFTVQQKHLSTVLENEAFPNYVLAAKVQEWVDKGFTVS